MAKRRTAWEGTSIDELIEVEFQDRHGGADLRPSVYVIDATTPEAKLSQVVRLRAEHAVSFMRSPNTAGPHVDLEGITPRPPQHSPGNTRFQFANDAHHEVVLENDGELREMVAAARADITTRAIPVSKDEVLHYVAERESHGDAEWLALLGDAAKSEWKKLVDKHRRACANPH